MKAYLEVLTHFHCDHCNKWWTAADISFQLNQQVYCPHCGAVHFIDQFQNGQEDKVSGISWNYLKEDSEEDTEALELLTI